MKKFNLWMFAAILTFCSAMVLSSCSSQEDNPALTPTTPTYEEGKGDLVNVWYSEYEATGTAKDVNDNEFQYTSIFERYVFNNDGTGRWSRYFMGDQPDPVVSYGGEDGDFTYTLGGNGKVTVVFKNNIEELFPQTIELTYADGQLTSGDIKFSVDTDDIVKEACEYWDDLFRMHGPDPLEDGDRIYGVGYGYNFILDHSKALSRAPILNMDFIQEWDKRKTSGIDTDIHVENYTGHSLSELANEFSANAHVSGGTVAFKGEVGAAFDAKYKKSSEHEYALTIIDVALTSVTLEMDLNLIQHQLNPAFKLALLGGVDTYRGEKGLYNLVRDYGTHLVCQAKLGGRVRYSNTVDISKVKGEYDLTAFAKVSYTGIGVSASGSVDDKFMKSFEENSNAIDTRITAIGGTPATVLGLMESDEEKFKAWRETLAEDDYKNTCVVAVEQVIPIWELVTGHEKRVNEIKRYINDGGYERDMTGDNNFLVGAMGKISDVTSIFTKEDEKNGTLVKNLEIDGNIVAQACKEFIPQFNASQRSIVLYPVVNNKPKYNLGYFIGNSSMAPCRVCWSMTSPVPSIINIPREKNIGVQKELYILGCSFLHNDLDKATIEAGQVRPVTANGFFMETKGLNSKGEEENPHKYPLVKIFNHVWTRENFSFPMDKTVYSKSSDNQSFYNHTLMANDNNRKRLPDGWNVPSNVVFQELWDELKNRNIQRLAEKMAVGGVIGFNAPWVGWMENNTQNDKDKNASFWAYKYDPQTKKADYLDHFYLRLDSETGNMSIIKNNSTTVCYSVRLIQETTW